MLSYTEKRILEILNQRHLITKGELVREIGREDSNGTDVSIQRLKGMGFVSNVESLGNCLVITQKGIRSLKERGADL
jgi:hypothetical protein